MTDDPFTVAANETGVVRVFEINADESVARAMREGDVPLETVLGVPHVDAEQVEIFPIRDLEGVGLVSYLIDGQGIAPETMGRDRAALEAIEGHVMVVLSRAFKGAATRIVPAPDLGFVAAFREDRPGFVPEAIPSAASLPFSAPQAADPDGPRRMWRTGSAVVGLTFVALALLLWWLLA
ncbi:MAG: hypothetical protein NXH82_00175 [Rhodobacteraceae bacterium]|nr:hypothetical protein [Paracoccaceae bacterium]